MTETFSDAPTPRISNETKLEQKIFVSFPEIGFGETSPRAFVPMLVPMGACTGTSEKKPEKQTTKDTYERFFMNAFMVHLSLAEGDDVS